MHRKPNASDAKSHLCLKAARTLKHIMCGCEDALREKSLQREHSSETENTIFRDDASDKKNRFSETA